MTNSDLVARICASRRVNGEDVLALRRAFYEPDGAIDKSEAEALFAINDACQSADEAWPALFVEALSDYLVYQVAPRGYVSDANAKWLIDRISASGRVKSATELELLVRIMEVANETPEALETFALAQVRDAVIEGTGVTRGGLRLEPGRVCEADVNLLRRIMFAYGGSRNIAVSRAEAEVLFDISDATAQASNHASWSDFFAKAVANHVMAISGYTAPSRQEALQREAWLDDQQTDIAGFLGKTLAGGLRGILASYSRDASWAERQLAEKRTSLRVAEQVDKNEADWLIDRIKRDGHIGANEVALLRFIRDESPDIHPDLAKLIDKVA